MKQRLLYCFLLPTILCAAPLAIHRLDGQETNQSAKSLNVLFIGNSYTARHHLSEVVKQLAEAGNPELKFNPTTVIYGGRRLIDHWQMGTQNVVNSHSLRKMGQENS